MNLKKASLGMLFSVLFAVVMLMAAVKPDKAYAAGEYTVTFVSDGETISAVTVDAGSSISDIEAPSKDGYLFAGWYRMNMGTIANTQVAASYAYTFGTPVTYDFTLYAGWVNIGKADASMLYLEGVQYRDTKDSLSGIRFVSKINLELEEIVKTLNLQNEAIRPQNISDKGLGYGTVVTKKKNIPSDGSLVKDEAARYVSSGMVVSPAVATFSFKDNCRYYTAVVTGLTEKYGDVEIAATPYITYYDANGSLVTYYYTEPANPSNVYNGAYFTTFNKVKAASNPQEPETQTQTEPETEPETQTEPETEFVEYGYPDVVVTSISMTPAAPKPGDNVRFTAVVKNQGTASTPAGVITGVYFSVNGYGQGMWSDSYTASIKPGQSVTLTANGGTAGSTWNASATGSYRVSAYVDDVNRYRESNENNNTMNLTFTVSEKSPIEYVTDPVTGDNFVEGFEKYNFSAFNEYGLADTQNTAVYGGSIVDAAGANAGTYVYEINQDLYFNRTVDKMVLNAGANAASGAVLNIYADDVLALSQALPSTDKELMLDLSEAGMNGAERIKFEVVLANDTNASDFRLNSFKFMYAVIPTVYLSIDESLGTIAAMNSDPNKIAECHGSILITSPEGYICQYTGKGVSDYNLDLEYIRGRGNSTWTAPKKPYKVKLAKKTDLFGMSKNKSWCLLANYYDKSLMRNKLAFDLAADIGMPFTPQCVYVDLVMNGEYLGSYQLAEQVKVDAGRVEIDDLEDTPDATDPEIISGGYMIEITPYDRVKSDEVSFGASRANKALVFESPSFEEGINQAQYNYMEDYYHRMEEAVYSSNGYNSRGEYWSDLLDIDSTADFFIMEELFKNNDAMYASARFYKPRGDKLHMGPIWDFDLTAGDYDWSGNGWMVSPEGWYVRNEYLFSELFRYSEFKQAVINRWWAIHSELEHMYTDSANSTSYLTSYYAVLENTAESNFDIWGYSNGGWNAVLSYGDWNAEVNFLRNWLQRRVAWMDANINGI